MIKLVRGAGADPARGHGHADSPAGWRRRRPRPALALVAAILAVLAAAGCGSARSDAGSPVHVDSTQPASALRGTVLDKPIPEPDVRLTDTGGHPFALRSATKGKLTLVYFGYTHCPDVCPTTMADLATALRELPAAQRAKVAVVFVTTDPARDTPTVIRDWLDSFDPSFIGLTGPFADIRRAARSCGVVIEKPKVTHGDYEVTHGAEVLAFGADQRAHVIYTSGTSSADYAHDLPKLLAGVAT